MKEHYRGLFKELLSNIKALFIPVVLSAEEPAQQQQNTDQQPNPTPAASTPEPINFEVLIQQARKEEKDKLYPKIKSLEDNNRVLVERNNELLLENAGLKQSVSSLEGQIKAGGGTTNTEEVSKLQVRIKELEEQLKDVVPREQVEKEVREQLNAEFELKEYKMQKIAEANGECIPELVTGANKEEIDASLEKAKERYMEIAKRFNPNAGATQQGFNTLQQRTLPSANPTSQSSILTQKDSMERLINLDPSSPEYAQLRKELGL